MSCFIDANVLVYAATAARTDPEKWAIAHIVLEADDAWLSGQVLAEFHTVALRSLHPAQMDEWLLRLAALPCVPVDSDLVLAGVQISRRYKISYWDGAILAAAERAGAETLYSEDLNDGQYYGSVGVVNPFREGWTTAS
jgi:predicted nucleic acid-binding protein